MTDAGRGYLVFARRVLADLDAAERYALDVLAGQAIVRIATSPSVISILLTQSLQAVHNEFPQLRLQPLDVAAGGILEAFAAGEADIAIGVSLPVDDEFEAKPLFESRWFAYLPAGHSLCKRRQLKWSELTSERLYMTKASNYLKLRASLGPSIDLTDVQESTAAAGIAMAAAGSGIAVFPAYMQPLAKVVGIKGIPIVEPEVPHELYIGTRRQPSSSAPIHLVRDAISRSMQENCRHLR